MSLNPLTEIDFSKLKVLETDGLSLIVYLPLDRTNLEVNRIRLKNAIAEVKALIEERQTDSSALKTLTQELEKLASHELMTHATYPGLALLAHLDNPDEVSVHPLWHSPEAKVSLAKTPNITPLVQNSSHQQVTLLCLADNALRLYRGHFGELHEQPLPEDLPKNLQEVKRFELQAGLDGNEFYRNKSKLPGGGSSHGEGPTSRIEAEFERRYFKSIGQALAAHLQPNEKLMLAGVKEKLDWFREENPDLDYLSTELHGNFERTTREELLGQANECLALAEKDATTQALDQLLELPPSRRLEEQDAITEAAKAGRVETLYLHPNGLPESERESLVLTVLRFKGKVKLIDDEPWQQKLLAHLRW